MAELYSVVTERAAEIIRNRRSGARPKALSTAVENLLNDTGGRLERVLYKKYPGAALGTVTSVKLSVEMPGPITGG